MKTLIVIAAVVLVLVPTAYATGQALDPRVPGLQRQVRALSLQVSDTRSAVGALQGQVINKLDKGCVDIVQIVIRPGYVYQTSNGNLIIVDALDRFRPEVGDRDPNRLMQLKNGC